MGNPILITPMPPLLGIVTHMCHDVVPATPCSVLERTLSEWPFRSVLGALAQTQLISSPSPKSFLSWKLALPSGNFTPRPLLAQILGSLVRWSSELCDRVGPAPEYRPQCSASVLWVAWAGQGRT